nr:methyltransferase domain-containing protein [Brachyspira sp.]
MSNGDDLPFKDNAVDFVFVSHIFEHFYDPIKALKE